MKPFDPALNAAILSISARLFPTGFDVADQAPDTYEKLKAHLDAGERLVVFSGGSLATIYGNPEINYAFRAWHDWSHWQGNHDLSFDGEVKVCEMQCYHLLKLYGDTERTQLWCTLVHAEIIGQALYNRYHKRFPENQKGFVEAYIKEADEALRWPLW